MEATAEGDGKVIPKGATIRADGVEDGSDDRGEAAGGKPASKVRVWALVKKSLFGPGVGLSLVKGEKIELIGRGGGTNHDNYLFRNSTGKVGEIQPTRISLEHFEWSSETSIDFGLNPVDSHDTERLCLLRNELHRTLCATYLFLSLEDRKYFEREVKQVVYSLRPVDEFCKRIKMRDNDSFLFEHGLANYWQVWNDTVRSAAKSATVAPPAAQRATIAPVPAASPTPAKIIEQDSGAEAGSVEAPGSEAGPADAVGAGPAPPPDSSTFAQASLEKVLREVCNSEQWKAVLMKIVQEVGGMKPTDWPKHPSFFRTATSFAELFLTALKKHKDCESHAIIQTIKEMKTAKSSGSRNALGEYVHTRNTTGIMKALIYAGISLVVPLVPQKVESRREDVRKDINKCTHIELHAVLSAALAQRTVEVRDTDGPFKSFQDLRMRVDGIGEHKIEILANAGYTVVPPSPTCKNKSQPTAKRTNENKGEPAAKRSALCCPITQEPFNTPVVATCCGESYERSAIEQWIRTNPRDTKCPQCRRPINKRMLVFNRRLLDSHN